MNYELAKQLKDAGFPQGGQWEKWLCNCAISKTRQYSKVHDWNTEHCPPKEAIYVPTLEELIEACGVGTQLHYHSARSTAMSSQVIGMFHERTPTEAVARLWLALNPAKLSTKVDI